MKISEPTMRDALLDHLRGQESNIVVSEEVRIEGGSARIDVVAFGEEIVGYEIKSDFDNFDRLYNQIHAYNRVFHKINFVCGRKNLNYAIKTIPSWWGILLVEGKDGGIQLDQIRPAKTHDKQDAYSVASLLSKEQSINILTSRGLNLSSRSSLNEIKQSMLEKFSVCEIEREILNEVRNFQNRIELDGLAFG